MSILGNILGVDDSGATEKDRVITLMWATNVAIVIVFSLIMLTGK